MRTTSLYQVFTFASTAQAMAFQAFCKQNNLPGRTIPVPTAIHAGCGLAWMCSLGQEKKTLSLATNKGIEFEAVNNVELFD